MAYAPPNASLGRLGTIVNLIDQATPINKEITKPPKIFVTLPGGQIFFDTGLELDTDGWPDGPDGDPSWQRNTSLRYADNSPINSTGCLLRAAAAQALVRQPWRFARRLRRRHLQG